MQLTSEISSKTYSCRKHDLRCTDICSLCDETCENRNLNKNEMNRALGHLCAHIG